MRASGFTLIEIMVVVILSKDPWGAEYHYENPGTHGRQYSVYTLGGDQQPGGEGSDADIGNWNVSD